MSTFSSMRCFIKPVAAALLALLLPGRAGIGAETEPPPVAPGADVRAPVKWESDIASALMLAQVSLKPVLVLFTAPRNMDSARLKNGPLLNPGVVECLRQYERVEIDASRQSELALQHQVRMIPAFRVLEPDGRPRTGMEGYRAAPELREALEAFLGGQRAGSELMTMAEKIRDGKAEASEWPGALLMMGAPEGKSLIRQAVLNVSVQAREPLVGCLTNPLLAVRSGALDLLEELAGDTLGFDPWDGAADADREAALERWNRWAASTNLGASVFGILTTEEFERNLRDLIGADQTRSARALRQLSQGGEMVVRGLASYLEAHPDLEEGALRRIREVRYALVIPPDSGLPPAATAHRLVWGNQDVQLQTIRQLPDAGARAMPILMDLLRSAEPLVRETAVEAAFAAAGRFAVKPLQAHLEKEQDPDVIYAILRQLGKAPTRRSYNILASFFTHANEDLAVPAIGCAAENLPPEYHEKVIALLEDPRWRVRVAALEAIQKIEIKKNNEVEKAVKKRLEDSDAFVRHMAVNVLMKKNWGAASELKKAYFAHPDMRGILVSALLAMGEDLPPSYKEDLLADNAVSLFQALDGLEKLTPASRKLVQWAAENDNQDIACAALRVLAASEERSKADNAVLVNALRNNSSERRLTVIHEFDVSYSKREQLRRMMLTKTAAAAKDESGSGDGERVGVFLRSLLPATVAAGVGTGTDDDVLDEMEKVMHEAGVSDTLQRSAMLTLCRFGNKGAFLRAEQEWESLTPEEQTRVAESLGYFGPAALPLYDKALKSRFEDVWQAAVRHTSYDKGNHFRACLVENLLEKNTQLTPGKVWAHGGGSLASDSSRALLPGLRPMLEKGSEKTDLLVFGLTVLAASKPKEDRKLAVAYTNHENAYVRRAAWMALTFQGKSDLAEQVKAIRADAASQVRDLLPALTDRQNNRVDVYFSEKEHFGKYDGLSFGNDYSSYQTGKLQSSLVDVLKAMAVEDPDPWIRFRCYLSLLRNGVAVDLNRVLAAGRESDRKTEVGEMVYDFFQDNDERLSRRFVRLFPLLRLGGGLVEDAERMEISLRRKWDLDDDNEETVETEFVYVDRPSQPEQVMAALEGSGYDGQTTRTRSLQVAYFTTPGCQSCKEVERILDRVKDSFPNLTVQKWNIRTAEGLRVNEVLCRRFDVPSRDRGITPAIFMSGGRLVKGSITASSIRDLAERSAHEADEGDWLKMTEEETAAAGEALARRFHSFTWPLVLGGGLVDGINPCAFAAMLFLVSYLRIRKRSQWEIVFIGIVYVASVFATYFVLGLGFQQVLAELESLSWLQRVVNRTLVLVLLILAGLSFRDGILCLKGRAGEMTLQLPDRLKSGIHKVVRIGSASPRYVAAAALLGVLVSLLELACTGQVYLPTIVYMAQDPGARSRAVMLLAVYNLAFAIPLIIVFLATAFGVANERFQAVMARHMAAVKFALALFFAVLFVVFLRLIVF